jgi:chemotaxis protein CheC
MQLTEVQSDALTELINIGFGRAAASLSQLTGHRVELEVPQVMMCPVGELSDTLRPFVTEEIASVHQVFTGPVGGDALLVLDHRSAGILKELLTDEAALPLQIDVSAREVIAEVGNILLNACLGVFGNLLRVQVSFAVPRVTLDDLEAVLESLIIDQEGVRYALVVHAGFRLKKSTVTGYLVIVLSVASVARLLEAVDRWESSR